jgi:hypothetical protein
MSVSPSLGKGLTAGIKIKRKKRKILKRLAPKINLLYKSLSKHYG